MGTRPFCRRNISRRPQLLHWVVSGRTPAQPRQVLRSVPRPAKLHRHFNHRPVLVSFAETITLFDQLYRLDEQIWRGGNSSFAILKLSSARIWCAAEPRLFNGQETRGGLEASLPRCGACVRPRFVFIGSILAERTGGHAAGALRQDDKRVGDCLRWL